MAPCCCPLSHLLKVWLPPWALGGAFLLVYRCVLGLIIDLDLKSFLLGCLDFCRGVNLQK